MYLPIINILLIPNAVYRLFIMNNNIVVYLLIIRYLFNIIKIPLYFQTCNFTM